jgi:hypothetical protein
MTFNTTNFNQGPTLTGATGDNNTQIYVNSSGNFAINYAVTLNNNSASVVGGANVFLKKNGVLVANTGTFTNIPVSVFNTQVSPQAILAISAGEYIEVWFSGQTTISANAINATGSTPATPSVIINLVQIR